MANYMTTDIELTAIADAIRSKASGGSHPGYHDYIMGLDNAASVDDPDAIIHVIYPEGCICTCTDGTTTITAPNTNGEANFGVEIGSWIVNVSNNIGKASRETIVIEQRKEIKEIDLSSSIFLSTDFDGILNNTSWEDISTISQAGIGDNYFDIGDCKAVTLNGKIGSYLTLSNTTLYVFILDFNHPINKTTADNNMIWGGFKTALTNGIDVALCDNGYDAIKTSGKYFNINHVEHTTWYNTNYGGWKGCDFRYDILGGTSTKPSPYNAAKTSATIGYDATQVTIDTPVANTLMAALPNDLRAVLRLWNRYVDYKGNSSNTDANCSTTTVDALSLLAEFEIFGSRTNANQYEQNHQKQMTYYTAGNSKIKYQHKSPGTDCYWWVSSAYYGSAYQFCVVNASGNVRVDQSWYSYGLAPAFKT